MSTASDDTRDTENPQEPVIEQAGGPGPRVLLGERLSQARQSREMSLNDASDRLRIRENYLEALESGDWTPLPEEVYVMGFLRQYAGLLGIDISKDMEALKPAEYHLTKPFTMPDPPIAMNRAWAITAAACFFVLLILFNVVDEEDKDMRPAPPPATLPLIDVTPDAETMTGDPGNPEDTEQQNMENAPASPLESANMPTEPESADVAPGTTPPETGGTTPSDATSVPTEQAAEPTANEEPAVVTVIEHAASTVRSPGTQVESHTYRIGAVNEDVWLQVHAPDGSLVKEALLRSGQGMRLSSDAPYLLLTAGNPLSLRIDIDGRSIAEPGSLGEKDKVLHDYRMEPAKH